MTEDATQLHNRLLAFRESTPYRALRITHPALEFIDDAVIKPIQYQFKNESGVLITESGVFYPDKRFCELSRHIAGNLTMGYQPGRYPDLAEPPLSGCHLFGGMLFGHFGHFLVESLGRLWALRELPSIPDGIIFIAGWGVPHDGTVPQLLSDLLTRLGINLPIRILYRRAQKIERLIVPSQIFGFEMAEGHPVFHQFIHNLRTKNPSYSIPRLYVSRTGMNDVPNEHYLVDFLKDFGYIQFLPEHHSVDEQIDAYCASERLIGIEGSALHLFGLVGNDGQKLVIVNRRPTPLKVLIRQIRGFCDIDAKSIIRLNPNGSLNVKLIQSDLQQASFL